MFYPPVKRNGKVHSFQGVEPRDLQSLGTINIVLATFVLLGLAVC